MMHSLISTVVANLSTILKDEIVLLSSVPKEVEELHGTFTALQALLEDAEGRRVNDKCVILWLEKLKDLAYDVEDMLDEWRTEPLRSQADEEDGSCSILTKVSSFSDSVMLRHNIGTRIKEAKQRLDDIAKETRDLGLNTDSGARQSMDSEIRSLERRERETSSLVNASSIVGRKDDVNEVMGLLMGESSQNVFSERKGKRKRSEDEHEVPVVVSIVGMGGLGKTTLAQLLYNDEKVQQHFERRMWVCVSEDFDVKRVTKSIIESAETRCDLVDLDPMQRRLCEMVHRKRFLLVLDDVWSEESEKWEKLKVPLQAGAAGSRVIITTRNENVASRMGSTHVHKLPALSDNDCWLLFSRTALRHRNEEDRPELEKIGREIVEKCGGLPLAAKTIGSLMGTKSTKRDWELVLENETWSSPDVSQGGILPALLLSYYNLPSPLKQCFAYCSLFPKDFEMESDQLVKLWMAQGFLRSEGGIDMEDIGRQHIDELLRRSLLQDVELDGDGNIVLFKIHDLIHDLAQFVAKGNCLLLENGKINVDLTKVRHASLNLGGDDELGKAADNLANFDALNKAKKLRTVISNNPIPVVLLPDLFHHLRLLRALDLSWTKLEKLPQAIKNLKCLQYLNLSWTEIVELPEEVTDLYNLQTLKLDNCEELRKLPEKLKKLINLRHLEFHGVNTSEFMPCGIGRLTALRSLTTFTIGDGKKGWGLGELKKLNHLQGVLEIEGLENVVDVEEARAAELYKKQHLNELYLCYSGEEKVNGMLENIRPPSNLKHLYIHYYSGYGGYTLPRWIEDPSFSNLSKIFFYSCRKCKQLPCLGKLPSLKDLSFTGMEEVRHVGVEFCGFGDDGDNNGSNGGGVSFPKLENLSFNYMDNWEEWELRGGVVMMPSLSTLEINHCSKLKALPDNIPSQLQRLMLEGDSPFLFDAKLPVFPNLKYLCIGECSKIKSIQGGWLGELKALDKLVFHYCQELECVPEELKRLTMLQELRIIRCPILEERCKVGGEDWHKIERVPHVKFSLF